MATLPGLTITAPADAGEGSPSGSKLFQYTVNKTINVAPACSVGWRVSGDVTPADFVTGQELSGRLTIPAGSSQGFIDLLIRQDAEVEPNETMTVELFDPTGCILLKQPAHGTVTVTDLYQVTYTPNSGFVGTDTFNYLVKNSDGQLASATIEVNVTSVGPPAFANGFEKKIEAFVGPDSEAMTGFELLFSITDPWLRTQTNGGVVRSNTGQDIRLEDGATPPNAVPYARLRYNPATGQVVGIAKRNRGTGSTWNNIELYAGNTKMVVEEANPAAALSGLLACWRLDNSSGQDISGNGRHLTVTTAMLTGQTLFEEPAGDFDRTKAQSAELANPSSWLNGLAAFSLMMDLQVDQITADAGVFRVGGTLTGADNLCFMACRAEGVSYYATPAISNFFYNLIEISGTEYRIEGSANSVRVGFPQTFALAWASGQALTQVVDDAVITPAYINPATATGTLTATGGPLAIAAGPRGSFDGKIGLVRLAATRRSNAWLMAEQRNRLYPRAMMAWGEAVGPNDTAACVAYPSTTTATGVDKTLSPLTDSTPDASGTGLKIISASAEQGAVTLIAATPVTQLLYKQLSGFAGVDHVTYTIQDSAGRKSTSLVTVTVSGTSLVVGPDFAETTGVAPVSIPVQANDSGVGRSIAITTAPDPAHGTAAIVGTGDTATITYTPIKPFFGVDSFFYTATSSNGQTAQGRVEVKVNPPPIQALAGPDKSVIAGTTAGVLLDPLQGDTGVDLVVSAVGAPAKGTATIVTSNTQIRYVPPTSVTTQEVITFSYTIRDAYGQTDTDNISVTVQPVAAPPPVAANDPSYTATSAQANFTLNPSPLANDTPGGVGGALTITGFAPASGVGSAGGTFARVSANKGVSYTAPTVTADVNDVIDYTISDPGPPVQTDTGTITVRVTAPVQPPTSNRPKGPPAPTSNARILTVNWTLTGSKGRYDTLAAAYNAAAAGDHIMLNDGSYTAPWFNRTVFTAANPVVIRCRHDGTAANATYLNKVVINGEVDVNQVGHWFHELKITDTVGIRSAGYSWFTRCWFTAAGRDDVHENQGFWLTDTAHHTWIGWCRFTGHGSSSQIKQELPTGTGGSWTTLTSGPRSLYIYRNYFHDNPSSPYDNESEIHYIYFGDAMVGAGGAPDAPHKANAQKATVPQNLGAIPDCFVEYNLIHHDGGTRRKRGFYLKRGCIFRFNHDQVTPDSGGFRHSRGGKIYGNTIAGPIHINGGKNATNTIAGYAEDENGGGKEYTECYSNKCSKIRIWTGSFNGDGTPGYFVGKDNGYVAAHQASNYAKLSNNQAHSGTLAIEFLHQDHLDSTDFAGGKVHDVGIWTNGKTTSANNGASSWVGSNNTYSTANNASYPIVTPITLTPSQVGQELANQK